MEDTFPTHRNHDANCTRSRKRFVAAFLSLIAVTVSGGCTRYMGTTSASFLRKVREEEDPNIRFLAYTKLSNPNCYETPAQKAEAVKTLVATLQKRNEPVASRAVILQTLGALKDPAARDVVLKATGDPEPILRVQACLALGKVGKPEDATVLARVMATDTLEDCRIAAIDALGELRPNDARIHRVLVAGMQHDDPATRLAALTTLRKISGKDFGVDALAWQTGFLGDKPDNPEKDSKALLASPGSAPAVKVANAPATGTYPPKLEPRTVNDPDAEAASFTPLKKPATSIPNGNPKYPAHNPNLPSSPPGF